MSWAPMIENILNEHEKSEDAGAWKKKAVCYAAAILDRNGNVLGSSGTWKKFGKVNVDCATADGMSTEKKTCDELKTLLAYVDGNDKPEPAGAVIMMGGKKYKHTRGPREEIGDVWGEIGCMSGGGFSVAKTEKLLIIGVWEKGMMDSTGGAQVPDKCTDMVARMAKFLKTKGL